MDSFDLSLLQFAFCCSWRPLTDFGDCICLQFETVLHFNWLIYRFSRLFATYLFLVGTQPGFYHLWPPRTDMYSGIKFIFIFYSLILCHYFVRITAKWVILAPCCCSWQWRPWKEIIGNWGHSLRRWTQEDERCCRDTNLVDRSDTITQPAERKNSWKSIFLLVFFLCLLFSLLLLSIKLTVSETKWIFPWRAPTQGLLPRGKKKKIEFNNGI